MSGGPEGEVLGAIAQLAERMETHLRAIETRLARIEERLSEDSSVDWLTTLLDNTFENETSPETPRSSLQHNMAELKAKAGERTDCIPIKDILRVFEEELQHSDSSLLTQLPTSENDIGAAVDDMLMQFGLRPDTYSGICGPPHRLFNSLSNSIVMAVERFRSFPGELLEDRRFSWHSLGHGLNGAIRIHPRGQPEDSPRPDWYLPKLVVCHAEGDESVAAWTALVTAAITGSVGDGRYEVSCFRFMGTPQQVYSVFQLKVSANVQLPCLMLFGDLTVNLSRAPPLPLTGAVDADAIYTWVTRALAIERVHVVLGAAGSMSMARQLSHDVRLSLLAYGGAELNDAVHLQLLTKGEAMIPVGGDVALQLPPDHRKQMQLRQLWVQFCLYAAPSIEDLQNCCGDLSKSIGSRLQRQLPHYFQDTLVFVGHGDTNGFLLQDVRGGYHFDEEEQALLWTAEGENDEKPVYLGSDTLKTFLKTVVGDSLSVVVITCQADVWAAFDRIASVRLPSSQSSGGQVFATDAASTWREVASLARRRWAGGLMQFGHGDLALVKQAANDLVNSGVDDINIEELARGSLKVRVKDVAFDKSVFGGPRKHPETCGRLMCWPAKNGDTYSLTIWSRRGDQSLHFIVDSGYSASFDEFVWPHIRSLYSSGGKIDATVVTHVDQDHICGMLAWAQFNKKQQQKKKHPRIVVRSDVTIVNAPAEMVPSEARGINDLQRLITAYKDVQLAEDANVIYRAYRDDVLDPDTASVQTRMRHLSAAPQISQWNTQFDTQLLIVHPTAADVHRHYDEAKGAKLEQKDDGMSWANITGIVLLFQCRNHRFLFCGDARASDILAGLEALRLLPDDSAELTKSHIGENNPLSLLTVPHHGSKNNSSQEFFRRLPARVYTVSSNGHSHDHPHVEVLNWLADAIRQSSVRPIQVRFSHDDTKREGTHRVDEFRSRFTDLPDVTVSCTLDDEHANASSMLETAIEF